MKGKKITFIASLALGACCFGGAATYASASAESEKKFTADLFLPSEIQIESASVPDSGEDMSLGVCLTTQRRESEIYFRNDVSGRFTLDFAPRMTNGTIALQEVEFTFTEVESGDSFTAFALYGSTYEVGVKLDGERAGLYYSNKKLMGLTTFANGGGTYTSVADERITLSFDPSDMSVYADGTLVWNFLESEQDGREFGVSFDPFGTYRVSIAMTEYIGVTASMMLYSVNSCALDKVVLGDVGAPTVSAAFNKSGLVGESYELPKGYGYDVWEGQLKVENEVVSPSKQTVAKNATSFLPKEAGVYTVYYTAQNAEGKTSTAEYSVEITEMLPQCDNVLMGEIPQTAYTGTTVFVPEMHVYGGLLYYDYEQAKVTVSHNGVIQLVYSDRVGGFEYPLQYEGNYKFSYYAGDTWINYETKVEKAAWRFDYDYQDGYSIGDFIDLTTGTLYVGEEAAAYTVTVQYPSGKTYENGKVVLDEAGLYRVSLTTENGSIVKQEIEVKERSTDNFSTTSSSMSIGYGKSVITGRSGVTVTTTNNRQTVNYNRPINLGKYVDQTRENANGTIVRGEKKTVLMPSATPFIEFSVEPKAYGKRTVSFIEITLTDAADPNNNIHIAVTDGGTGGGWTYIAAGAGTQGYAGLHQGDPAKWYTYNIIGTYTYGLYTHHSFSGKTGAYQASNNIVRLYYDNEEKQILTEPSASPLGTSEANHIVADFDNSDFCHGTPWTGFTSDEVYLSITMGTLVASEATCIVYSIDGATFMNEYVDYDTAPTISVRGSYILEGVKGQTLSVPEATAYDATGVLMDNVLSYVYYEADGKEYAVETVDGKFRTDRAGEYVIYYSATDKFGNEGGLKVHVIVHETYGALSATVQPLEAELTGGKTGTAIALAPISKLTIDNALGKTTATAAVTFGGAEVSVQDGKFIPERAGAYTVTFTVTDGTGRTATASYTVTVALETEPVIVSSVPVYVAFVRGNAYKIKEIYIKDYTLETIEPILTTVYINGEKYDGKTYTPENLTEAKDAEEKAETVTIEYKYGEELIRSYEVPVRTVYKKYDKKLSDTITVEQTAFLADRFFQTEGGATLEMNSINMKMTATADGAAIRLAQPLASENLTFGFDVAAVRNEDLSPVETGVERVQIRITDANDESKSLLFSIERNADGETVAFVGGEECSVAFSGSLTATSLNAFLIRLDNAGKTFYDGNTGGKLVEIKTFENGKDFDGFSDSVYLAVTVDVTDGQTATLQSFNFNGQTFSSNADDQTAPKIEVNGVIEGSYPYTSTVKIPTATASDVLSNVSAEGVRVTVSYVAEDGSDVPAYDVNGKELTNLPATEEYELKLDRIGEFKVTYSAKDTRKGDSAKVVLLQSYIAQEPVLEIKGKIPTSARVGDTVKLPSFKATYAEGSKENLCYAVYIAPSGVYQLVQTGEFALTEVGTYKLRFLALDEYGNYAIVEYKIAVTA